MTHRTVDYAGIIRRAGHRLTPQRELILDAVCQGGGHTTFEEIYRRVQAQSNVIDASTVYRSLDFFCRIGLVTVAEICGERVYEIAVGQPRHHHLICHTCGAQVELADELVKPLFETIERLSRFAVDANHLIIYGLCLSCCSKQKSAGVIGSQFVTMEGEVKRR